MVLYGRDQLLLSNHKINRAFIRIASKLAESQLPYREVPNSHMSQPPAQCF
jgi:hypothetical protein